MATGSTVAVERGVDDRRSGGRVRLTIAALSAVWALMVLGLVTRAAWATWIWPWSDGRLTYIFLGSIAAAVAAPLAWIALVDEPAGLAGISIDGAAIGGMITPALVIMGLTRDEPRLLLYAAGAGLSTLTALLVFRRWHPVAPVDIQPIPLPVKIAFALFVAVLLPVGAVLMLRIGVFPSDLPSGTSTIVGAMFIGAAAYFAYGLWRNCWAHAGGPLIGFLAYDLVLLVPYLRLLGDDGGTSAAYGSYGSATGGDTNQTSLVIYLIVIVASGLLGIYYLGIHRPTRIRIRG